MTQTLLSGPGIMFPWIPQEYMGIPTLSTAVVIDAATERASFNGRVWWPDAASHAVRKIHFRTGATSGTGTLRVSLQATDLVNGPPMRGDGTILGAGAAGYADLSTPAANSWVTTGNLGADVTLAPGALVSVDFAYAAWTDASIVLSVVTGNTATNQGLQCTTTAYIGAPAWATQSGFPNVILEDSTGTVFGTLLGALPFSALTSVTFNVDTAYSAGPPPVGDEIALVFTPTTTMKVSGVWAYGRVQGDMEICLYDNTTLLKATTLDANAIAGTSAYYYFKVPLDQEYTLTAGQTYLVSMRPTTTSNIITYVYDLNAAGHRMCHPGGTAIGYAARSGNSGAWSSTLTTRVPLMGFIVSSIDDGASSGSGGARAMSGGFV